jgi:acetyltransferase-like isoleucine patch superfamily enzyme
MAPGSRIRIEDGVTLCSDSRFTALGVTRPVILRTMRSGASIHIGAHAGLSGTVVCAAQSVSIGAECLMGSNVLVADNDFHPLAPAQRRHSEVDIISAPVVIEDNVFVGTGSMVLRGVTIGSDSVIGAGSVVTRNVPAGVVAAGNPARTLRPLDAAPSAAADVDQ